MFYFPLMGILDALARKDHQGVKAILVPRDQKAFKVFREFRVSTDQLVLGVKLVRPDLKESKAFRVKLVRPDLKESKVFRVKLVRKESRAFRV